MPFDDLTFRSKYGNVGLAMSSEIVAAGVSSNPIFVEFVSRAYIYSLLSEQGFGESDKVDAHSAAKIGKFIGVDVFVFGRITAITPNYPKVAATRGNSRKRIFESGQPYDIYAQWIKYSRVARFRSRQITKSLMLKQVASSTPRASKGQHPLLLDGVKYTGSEDAIEREVLAYTTTGDVSVGPPDILANRAVRIVSQSIAANILANYEE